MFGYSEYKGKQKEIFEAAIKGMSWTTFSVGPLKDVSFLSLGADVLVVAPTGMGKVGLLHAFFLARA